MTLFDNYKTIGSNIYCTYNSYRKFGNFREGFIFAKLRSFVKMKTSRFRAITLLFTDIGNPYHSRDFSPSQICLLSLFANIKFSRKFPNLQWYPVLVGNVRYEAIWSPSAE